MDPKENDVLDIDENINNDPAPETDPTPPEGTPSEDETITKIVAKRLKEVVAPIREQLTKAQFEAATYKAEMDTLAQSRGFTDYPALKKADIDQRLRKAVASNDIAAIEAIKVEIANADPEKQVLKQTIEQTRFSEAEQFVAKQVSEVSKIDAEITSFEDLVSKPKFKEWDERVRRGMTFAEAYELTYKEELRAKEIEGVRRQTQRSEHSLDHMRRIPAGNTPAEVVVPKDVYAQYKHNLPDWTDAQIKKDYAEFLESKK